MSSSTVISDASKLLRALLQQGLGANDIVLVNPGDQGAPVTLSLWLYQVTPNEHLRNVPNIRIQNENFDRLTPLPLDLCYLLTPLKQNEEENQITLGRALQVIYDNSILTLNAGNNVEQLHLSICQRSIEELAKVWEALQKPYRLSICFEVRVVRIDSERTLNAGRIADRETRFEELPEEVAV
jgi:hypothetical protein